MRILIVEDEKISRRLLASILKPYAECDTAENGEEAYLKFNQSLETKQPFDLIFLDIMMPEVDGQETLAAIRELENELGVDPELAVKVVMTTALDDGMNIYDAHVHGCSNYVIKPISQAKVLEVLTKCGLVADADLEQSS